MSKAVLVMDMPSSCDKCPCFCGHYSDMCCVGLNNRTIDYPYPKDFRQRWCPLKELPDETHNDEYMDECGNVSGDIDAGGSVKCSR